MKIRTCTCARLSMETLIDLMLLKDTHRENKSSKKNQGLRKSINMDNWVIGPSNQQFIRSSFTQIKVNKSVCKA